MELSALRLLALLLLSAGLVGLPACRLRPARKPPEKILLISIDTTRADHLSCYGYQRRTTPGIDQLAAQGVRLANVYSPMPTTDPSHTTMLTGEYPRTHGLMRNAARRKDRQGPSLAAWLRGKGYTTASITARLGLDPKLRGIRGFDFTDAPRAPKHWRSGAEVLDLVRRWLARRQPGERWFLWAHLWEPHKPYEPPRAYRRRFGAAADKNAAAENPPRFLRPAVRVPANVVEQSVRLYDGEIAVADDAVVKLVAAARDADPATEEPLLLIVSDHGEALAERQAQRGIAFGHGAMIYDEVVRVPWIVVWKGVIEPHVLHTPVSLVDLTPTVTGLVDPRDPIHCEGRSLASSLLSGREPPAATIVVERRLFSTRPKPELGFPETAWIKYPWKLIVNEGAKLPELYRLDSDPTEQENLAERFPAKVQSMAGALSAWKKARPLGPSSEPRTREREQELDALRSLGYID